MKVNIQSERSSKNVFLFIQAAGRKSKYFRGICPQHFRTRTGPSGRRFVCFCSCLFLTVVVLMELLHPAARFFLFSPAGVVFSRDFRINLVRFKTFNSLSFSSNHVTMKVDFCILPLQKNIARQSMEQIVDMQSRIKSPILLVL